MATVFSARYGVGLTSKAGRLYHLKAYSRAYMVPGRDLCHAYRIDSYRSSEARVSAEVAAVDHGGVETSQELEITSTGPWLHDVQPVFDAELAKQWSDSK